MTEGRNGEKKLEIEKADMKDEIEDGKMEWRK